MSDECRSTHDDDRGVEADPAVEQEVAAVHLARARCARNDRRSSEPSSCAVASTGSSGDAERAGVDVRGAAREGRERGLGADEPVGRLVQRAVAAEHRDDLDAPPGRAAGEAGRVPAPRRLRHLEVVLRAERLLDHHPLAGRHRRRGRVHDEQDAHDEAG